MRIWIANAPAGTPSSGPATTTNKGVADEYREMGWSVEGPCVLVSDVVERLREPSVPHNHVRHDYADFIAREFGDNR